MMLDIAVAYNRYRFLGNEFLTWLWFITENEPELIQKCDTEALSVTVGNRIVLENRQAGGKETITIKGDAAGLEEGLLALSKGAEVTEVHLVYKSGSFECQFSLKGESLALSNFKLPETSPMESADDIEGMTLEKIYLYEKPLILIDCLFQVFIKKRLKANWTQQEISKIKAWAKPPAV